MIRHLPSLRLLAMLAVFFLAQAVIPAQTNRWLISTTNLPLIAVLSGEDPVFKQVKSDVNAFLAAGGSSARFPQLFLSKYACVAGDTLSSISAKLGLPYSALASLNRLGSPGPLKPGQIILIPNQPGLHLAATSSSQVETLMHERLKGQKSFSYVFMEGAAETLFDFYAGEDFSPKERMAFMGKFFLPPLSTYRLSSRFGPRRNPVSGALVRHDGLDMVAPWGSPVLAARDGTVALTGYHAIYGKYVVIDHPGGYTTMYGHLQDYRVAKGQSVLAGDQIGRLGNTGQSTGAHLHFEIQFEGKAQDPLKYFR